MRMFGNSKYEKVEAKMERIKRTDTINTETGCKV
jgi:hypothetical protein